MDNAESNKTQCNRKTSNVKDNPDAFLEEQAMQERLGQIKHKIIVYF